MRTLGCYKNRMAFWLSLLCLSFSAALPAETLLQAYEQALKKDPSWTAARETFLAERQAKSIGLAGLLPQIYGSATLSTNEYATSSTSTSDSLANLSNVSFIDALGCVDQYGTDNRSALLNCINQQKSVSNSNNTRFTTTTYGINLTQPLFRLDRWYQYQQSRLMTDKAHIDFVKAQQDLMLKVAEAYFTALRAQDDASFAQVQVFKLSAQLQGTKKLFSLGQAKSNQVYQAQAALDLSQANKIVADSSYQAMLEILEGLTHNPTIDVIPLPFNIPIEPPQPTNPAAWVETAKTHNLEVQSAQIAARAAHSDYLAKQAGHAPTMDFFTSYSQTHSNGLTSVIDEGRTSNTVIGLNFNLPIYSGGLTSSLAKQAKHRQFQSDALSEALSQKAVADTRQFYRSVITRIKHIEAQQVAVTSEEQALDAIKQEYQYGQAGVSEVLDAQQKLFSAQKELSDARYDYILDTLRLKRAAGVLALDDLKILNAWFEAPQHINEQSIENVTLPKKLSPQPLDPHAPAVSTESERPHNLVEALKKWLQP